MVSSVSDGVPKGLTPKPLGSNCFQVVAEYEAFVQVVVEYVTSVQAILKVRPVKAQASKPFILPYPNRC